MCLYIDYDGSWVDLDKGERKARKEHTCCECSRTIEAGEKYHYWVQVERGYAPSTVKMCAHCRATISACAAMTGCPQQWYWSMVIGTDEETYTGDALLHELPPGGAVKILRMIVLARKKWRDRQGELVEIPRVEALV